MESIKSTKFSYMFNEIDMVDLEYMKNKFFLTKIGKLAFQFGCFTYENTIWHFLHTLFKKNQKKLLQSETSEEACKEPIRGDLSMCVPSVNFSCFINFLGNFLALMPLQRLFLWKITVIETLPTNLNKNYWQIFFV